MQNWNKMMIFIGDFYYRQPLLSEVLLFVVLTIRGLRINYKIHYLRAFLSVIHGIGTLKGKTTLKDQNSDPSLSTVLLFAGYSWDVTPRCQFHQRFTYEFRFGSFF